MNLIWAEGKPDTTEAVEVISAVMFGVANRDICSGYVSTSGGSLLGINNLVDGTNRVESG